MNDLPVMLRVRGRRCVVVGGGAVAVRRAAALRDAGAAVTVIAPEMHTDMPAEVERLDRAYQPGDLADALLVVIATDERAVNEQVAADAARLGVLTNRADAPDAGDFAVPAHAHHGPVTIAVHTGGVSAAAGGAIRRQLSEALGDDWPRLLTAAAPFRERIQAAVAHRATREAALKQLTDEQAMRVLRSGGVAALEAHCRGVYDRARQQDSKKVAADQLESINHKGHGEHRETAGENAD